MDWWGGPGAGSGGEADNGRDFFITGLRVAPPSGSSSAKAPYVVSEGPETMPGVREAQEAEARRQDGGSGSPDPDDHPGRPCFNILDFLVYHLPSLTASQERAQASLQELTTNAFWDKVLPNDPETRDAAHTLLAMLRKDLDHDTTFSRRYGYILFSGDTFGRDKSVMQ